MTSLPAGLLADLCDLASGPLERPLPNDQFDDLARRVFEYQLRTNQVYRAFCAGRGVTPERWPGWKGVPAVPTRGFKELDLISGDPADVEAVFRTSGTRRGAERRGTHHVASLELYRTLALPWFEANLLPDVGPDERVRVISLIPSRTQAGDSSLSAMVGFVMEARADAESRTVVDVVDGLDAEALVLALRAAERDAAPTLLLGTAFAYVHALDALETAGVRGRLPAGSRAMETGGFKGRSREVPRAELYAGIAECTGIEPSRIVNEYGMTELLSQFYEPSLRDPGGPRRQIAPPWMRTRILSPSDLSPVAPGEPGLLQHFDLANIGSVSAVLTEDVGRAVGDGFEVLGRTPGSEPRGCSLAMEELTDGGRG